MTLWALAAAGLFLLLVLSGGCAGEAGDSSGPTGGKADDDTSACEGARLDKELFCRAPDGRFAATSCCADEFAATCANTKPDADGEHCRSTATGRFVPSACCEALCAGAAIDASGFCRIENGRFAPRGCCADQCFTAQEAGLEADDFSTGGTCAASGTCSGRAQDGDCFCDATCDDFGDCCADKEAVCGGAASAPSCAGHCGDSPNEFCFCDERCAENGDCCPDVEEACGQAGDQVTDCADPCAGAALDGDGVCRNGETGRFVKQFCCAAALAALCANTAPDPDGAHCRRDSGQFAPAICCESLCPGAALDAQAVCRLPGGSVAEIGCCADECVVAQSRLGRDAACGEAGSR
jgi:hypothetical protein